MSDATFLSQTGGAVGTVIVGPFNAKVVDSAPPPGPPQPASTIAVAIIPCNRVKGDDMRQRRSKGCAGGRLPRTRMVSHAPQAPAWTGYTAQVHCRRSPGTPKTGWPPGELQDAGRNGDVGRR